LGCFKTSFDALIAAASMLPVRCLFFVAASVLLSVVNVLIAASAVTVATVSAHANCSSCHTQTFRRAGDDMIRWYRTPRIRLSIVD
jgi:hypothetical protein